MKLIRPHGGTLVNREVAGSERARLIESAADMPRSIRLQCGLFRYASGKRCGMVYPGNASTHR